MSRIWRMFWWNQLFLLRISLTRNSLLLWRLLFLHLLKMNLKMGSICIQIMWFLGQPKNWRFRRKMGWLFGISFDDLGKSISLTSKLRKSQLMKRKKRMRKVEGKRRRETLLQFKNSWKRPERKRSSQRNSNSNQDFQTNEDEKDKNLSWNSKLTTRQSPNFAWLTSPKSTTCTPTSKSSVWWSKPTWDSEVTLPSFICWTRCPERTKMFRPCWLTFLETGRMKGFMEPKTKSMMERTSSLSSTCLWWLSDLKW